MIDAPLRVLLTVPNFWPHVGRGSERLVHDIAEQLARRGHRTTVVTRMRGALPQHTVMDGFDVRYWPHPRGLDRILEPYSGFAATAAAAALTLKADVANAFYPTDAAGLRLAGRLRRVPYIVSFHGLPDREWWERNLPRTHRRLLQAVDGAAAVTVLSRHCADRFHEDYGVEPLVLTPGIELERWPMRVTDGGRRRLVCTAAVGDTRKHTELLVDAFGLIAGDAPDLEIAFYGPGDPTGIFDRASRLDTDARRRVICPRPAPGPQEVPALVAACTAGCLVSQGEAFGIAAVEYLACGLPVVATGDAGVAQIVTPETGRLVPVGDVNATAQAMREVLAMAEDPATATTCRARAADFSWDVLTAGYESLYRRVADGERLAA